VAVELSVVVPCSDGCRRAGETLEALAVATRDLEAEVILADGSSDGSGQAALERAPARRLVLAGANAAELRAAGVEASSKRCVALVEPWTRPVPLWAHTLLERHAETGRTAVVGGPVVYDGPHRAAALAEFLFEYGAFLPPFQGEVRELPVNNVSYPRELLERYRSSWRDGFWKHFLHRELRAAGLRFLSEPRALVRHARVVPLSRFLRERVDHGQAYAARRGGGAARALLAPLLPPILASRLAREVAGKPGGPRALVRALGPLLAAEVAWSLGEALGYVAGDLGSSRRVF
jgi:glycosyltransferase involved in cell wall biosynthesis